MPPWKAGEDMLMAHRVRARHVFERARSSTPAVPDNVPKREKRYWQRVRDENPPLQTNTFDYALGDHVLFKNDLPAEEVYDTVRGLQDLAVDDEATPQISNCWITSTTFMEVWLVPFVLLMWKGSAGPT